jgi:hypothetical protein
VRIITLLYGTPHFLLIRTPLVGFQILRFICLITLLDTVGRLDKTIFTTSRYPLEIQWGYVHGMSLDLEKKYIS